MLHDLQFHLHNLAQQSFTFLFMLFLCLFLFHLFQFNVLPSKVLSISMAVIYWFFYYYLSLLFFVFFFFSFCFSFLVSCLVLVFISLFFFKFFLNSNKTASKIIAILDNQKKIIITEMVIEMCGVIRYELMPTSYLLILKNFWLHFCVCCFSFYIGR